MYRFLLTIPFLIILASCTDKKNGSEEKQNKTAFVAATEAAHHKQKLDTYAALECDIRLYFGGQERVRGKIAVLTGSGKGMIAFEDGRKVMFIGNRVFRTMDGDAATNVRFTAYTWTYFFMLPYKLGDAGTVWNDYPEKQLNGKNYDVQKLSFEQGTGDAPKDWYIIYADPQTHLVHTAAYIVTAHGSVEEAEQNPHAITYSEYKTVEDIPFATHWIFQNWDKNTGVSDTLGEAFISNIRLLKEEGNLFDLSENMMEEH